ncbi:MAG TPA: glycosyltransferase family 4 protein [Candidatus Brocadiia bacterium]|nr:glycosyltransferase family 4 protein [Candidatus Brocadiia bacterium]
MKKVAILFRNFGPYHIARIKAAASRGRELGWEVTGIESASAVETYLWKVGDKDAPFNWITLFKGRTWENVPQGEMERAMTARLNELRPDALIICSYFMPEMLAAYRWAVKNRAVAVLMSESNYHDSKRFWPKEAFKRWICRNFDSALVGGNPQRDYIESLGIPRDRIFLGYDAVDNDFFARQSDIARTDAEANRKRLSLPEKYFISVSRFVPVKNVPGLITEYAEYRRMAGDKAWDLVVCGGGSSEGEIRETIKRLNVQGVHLPGFTQLNEIGVYYGLAGCFVLASIIEPWGLVVNEAMASGLPILVTSVAGSSFDLVKDGENGWRFDPRKPSELAGLMLKISSMSTAELAGMSEASRRLIAPWGAERFASGVFDAIACGKRK